jgi:hypothetical protein
VGELTGELEERFCGLGHAEGFYRQLWQRMLLRAVHGECLTKHVILEMYDQMAVLPTMHVPAPKDESATYAVPDVGQWVMWLSPGPADARVAHGDTRSE